MITFKFLIKYKIFNKIMNLKALKVLLILIKIVANSPDFSNNLLFAFPFV